ncbi:NERD domain-containing protein [Alteribacter natronophilus]|uniref:NERD domain-containing protein n=1 Tax=Alteribacter natronophilus TaxID=2583810 RepID=UPI00110E9F8E|nr:NERD domain-containing protein [Alteribacter natronophilus]TMW72768.1 aldolase [Alteribacter natronophilus]
MSIIDRALYRAFNGKRTITKPIFVKPFTRENRHIKNLEALLEQTNDADKKQWIEQDILYAKQGIQGEANVAYELQHSFTPMLCLHDIRLEYDGYTAQFDFIIITRKDIIVLETKKLAGDVTITEDGDFVRLYKNRYGKVYKKEGIYSPVTQNERHVEILRNILQKENLFKNPNIRSGVVLANPKTVLNKSRAPKRVKEQIYKYNQVKTLIRRELDNPKNEKDTLEKYLYDIASFLKTNHTPIEMDLKAKYRIDNTSSATAPEVKTEAVLEQKIPDRIRKSTDKLEQDLKAFRLETARENNLKAYMVFSNAQMAELIAASPTTKEELLNVKGFGEKKVEMYGEQILRIFENASTTH